MSTNTLVFTLVAYIVLMVLVYVGVTNTSDFKNLPEEKQLTRKNRVKIAMAVAAAVGIIQLLSMHK